MLSRRTFIGWLGGIGAAIGAGVRADPVASAPDDHAPEPLQPAMLDGTLLTRIGEALLPEELGDAEIGRVSRAFARWAGGFRPGAELVHPYGNANLQFAGESPAIRWRRQLAVLDRAARTAHRRGFAALTRDQRRALLRPAVEAERGTRLPDAATADHVALALLAWYFATPDATDRCYRARIGRNQCRTLSEVSGEPMPLGRGGRPPAGGAA